MAAVFKNKASQQGFYEWWNRDYIKQFTKGYREDEKIVWLLKIAFEAGISTALSILQQGISPLTETTTDKLD